MPSICSCGPIFLHTCSCVPISDSASAVEPKQTLVGGVAPVYDSASSPPPSSSSSSSSLSTPSVAILAQASGLLQPSNFVRSRMGIVRIPLPRSATRYRAARPCCPEWLAVALAASRASRVGGRITSVCSETPINCCGNKAAATPDRLGRCLCLAFSPSSCSLKGHGTAKRSLKHVAAL